MTDQLDHETSSIVAAIADTAQRWGDQAWELRQLTAQEGTRPDQFIGELADAGYAGLMVPAEHGGNDGGVLALTLATEVIAGAGLAPQLWPLTHAAAALIHLLGTAAQHADHLPGIASGRTWWAMAFTEPDVGHDFRSITTEIDDNGETVSVTGSKCFISGADVADMLFVVGRLGTGLGAVAVPADSPGVGRHPQDMGGREGLQQFALDIDVEVPRTALIGEGPLDLGRLQAGLIVERLTFLAAGVGFADHALRHAVERARERIVFGDKPIGSYQAISHPLAQAHALLEGARLHLHRTASRAHHGHPPGEVVSDALISALLVTQAVTEATDRALQTHGGAGWVRSRNLLDAYLDARAMRSSPVAEELVRSIIAERTLGLPRDR